MTAIAIDWRARFRAKLTEANRLMAAIQTLAPDDLTHPELVRQYAEANTSAGEALLHVYREGAVCIDPDAPERVGSKGARLTLGDDGMFVITVTHRLHPDDIDRLYLAGDSHYRHASNNLIHPLSNLFYDNWRASFLDAVKELRQERRSFNLQAQALLTRRNRQP